MLNDLPLLLCFLQDFLLYQLKSILIYVDPCFSLELLDYYLTLAISNE